MKMNEKTEEIIKKILKQVQVECVLSFVYKTFKFVIFSYF